MATAALVDSSFFVRQQRHGMDVFAELRAWADHHELLTCGMVRLEVLRGLRSEPVLRRYTELFAALRDVPTTARTWEIATGIARTLERKGTPIPPQDSLIAAHALEAGAVLIALDFDFRRVPGLTVLNRPPGSENPPRATTGNFQADRIAGGSTSAGMTAGAKARGRLRTTQRSSTGT